MEILKEIINIITKNRIKNIEIIGNSTSKSSKLNELYSKIQNNYFTNDEEASSYFYGSNSENSNNFKKLKKRLHKRLINTIFFIDINQPSFNEIQKAYYTSYKDLAAIKILLGKSARHPAISIAKGVFNNAKKFEFSDLALDMSRLLRAHYCTLERSQKKYDFYNVAVKKYIEILNAELLAEEYHQKIVNYYHNTKANLLKVEQSAIKYSEELKSFTKHLQSYRLNLFSFQVFILRYQIVNDYKKMLIECEKAVHHFESKKDQTSKGALVVFLYKTLACHIQLKEFEKGEFVAQRCLKILPAGSSNWFETLEQYLLLSFHTNNLTQAYQIFCKAIENKNFNKLYENASENWRAHEAYIHYFMSIGAIKLLPNEKPKLKKFRISRFLNDMPVHSKDKSRRNIPILIVHVLFLLQKKEFEEVINRVESLNQYCYRYLRKDNTFRSNCFIKMLLQLPKANFHREAAIRKTEKYYNKLIQNPSNISMNASAEVEIMPYEMLWKYVLDSLDNKIYANR